MCSGRYTCYELLASTLLTEVGCGSRVGNVQREVYVLRVTGQHVTYRSWVRQPGGQCAAVGVRVTSYWPARYLPKLGAAAGWATSGAGMAVSPGVL